ncbi:pol polyprotein [Carpediemonas membranifera]|uniref:Pol polyprotein n=1 Tax=Carpediemonas membranifera TaxID=201153 RepID=A0A8J6E489_9EUKA|nr:pol polyprotein [Carpediemonas membranifera]|eukprot:KAG9396908.1 pol polyprotein [Carpediemonas membranifera]
MPRPTTIKELRRVLGKFNFLARFIDGLSEAAEPLHQLLRPEADITTQWGEVHDAAYAELKRRATADTILALPDVSKTWVLETDASDVACGGVLWQVSDDESRLPISFFGHKFTETQRRWATVDQELYGIIHCVTRADLAPLLKLKPFLIRTDHKNLVTMVIKSEEGNRKLTRWRTILAEYPYSIEHVKGADNVVADSLSRPPVVAAVNLSTEVRAAQAADPSVSRLPTDADGLHVHDGVAVIPEGATDLKAKLIAEAHRYHAGAVNTAANLRAMGFTWPAVIDDCRSYVSKCALCQKARLARFRESALASTMVHTPFDTVSVDTVGPLHTDAWGNRFILVIIDAFTRYVELVPMPNHTADSVAGAIWTAIMGRHGLPTTIRTDNGPEFVNRVLNALLRRLNVTHHRTLPYHPASNGIVERVNYEIKRHLRLLCAKFNTHSNWSPLVPYVQHVINHSRHSATGFTPHQLLFGYPSGLTFVHEPADRAETEPLASLDDYMFDLQSYLDGLRAKAVAKQERIIRSRSAVTAQFKAGDFVLLANERETKLHGAIGPFKVVSIGENKAVTIQHLVDLSERTVHQDKLFLFDADATLEQMRTFAVGDREEFLPSRILSCDRDAHTFLIEWDGFPASEATEEPMASLANHPKGKLILKDLEEGQDVAFPVSLLQ